MEFNQDFRDMLVALNEAKVKYLVVGAYAVAAHGWRMSKRLWTNTESRR